MGIGSRDPPPATASLTCASSSLSYPLVWLAPGWAPGSRAQGSCASAPPPRAPVWSLGQWSRVGAASQGCLSQPRLRSQSHLGFNIQHFSALLFLSWRSEPGREKRRFTRTRNKHKTLPMLIEACENTHGKGQVGSTAEQRLANGYIQ